MLLTWVVTDRLMNHRLDETNMIFIILLLTSFECRQLQDKLRISVVVVYCSLWVGPWPILFPSQPPFVCNFSLHGENKAL